MFKYSQKRNLEWVRSLEDDITRVNFIDHSGVNHSLDISIGNNIIIFSTGQYAQWLAYMDRFNELHTKTEYFSLFPFNGDTREDFIDTVWCLLNQDIEPLFYTASGKISKKAVDIFTARLDSLEFNSVAQSILSKLNVGVYNLYRKVAEKVSLTSGDLDILLPNHMWEWGDIYDEEQESIEERMICGAEVMRNLRYHIEIEEYDDEDDEDNPRKYWVKNSTLKRPEERVTCKCGSSVPKREIYGNKCIKCITVPKEKLKINGYSERAEKILKFKESLLKLEPSSIVLKHDGTNIPSSQNRENGKEYYQKYLLSIGVSVKGNESSSEIYIGAELEYECTNRDIAKVEVLELLHEFAILKTDGSLRNGFEIVTMPATYEKHKEYLEPFFSSFPSSLEVRPNCGLHFHVSRKPLSLMTQGKLIEFMNRDDNGDFLTLIAGRDRNSYTPMDSSRTIKYILQGSLGQRYNTLNVNNPDTLEFRIFSPAITWVDYASKIEFCLSLVEYLKPCVSSASLKGKTIEKKDNITVGFELDPELDATHFKNYTHWLQTQRKHYPNLHLKIFGENNKKKKYLEQLENTKES